MIEKINIRLIPEDSVSEKKILNEVSQISGIELKRINQWRIIKKSIDARQRQIYINLTILLAIDDDKVLVTKNAKEYSDVANSKNHIIIVGAGPAGLFAALRAIELGIKPIILERGSDVDTRRKDLANISKAGKINPESNYCFGEGGAGAYSDGKLFTRSKKRGNVDDVLQILHQFGASENILIDAHPHIGSDKLPLIIKNIRQTIIKCGGEVHFNTKVVSLIIEQKEVKGVEVASGNKLFGPVILATGHSARDVYKMLHDHGVKIESKGLAIGVRLEHPQSLIDQIQYHSKVGRGEILPPAEYSFVTQVNGRGVYSFCMCPGGIIVPAASADNQLVVNGMSPSNRGSRWSNSGMVVEIRPGDFPEFSMYGEFEMMELQKSIEENFYNASGKSLNAPAQRMIDFINNKISVTLPKSSYAPGIHSAPIHFLLPKGISERLQEGFKQFGKRSKGFLTQEAILIGLESRTSSPIRIPRDPETLCHVEISRLYPCGEGAGYAGGIVSSAIDGMRCVEIFYKSLNNQLID